MSLDCAGIPIAIVNLRQVRDFAKAPLNWDSGRMRGRRVIWSGRAAVRKALYGGRCISPVEPDYRGILLIQGLLLRSYIKQ